MIEQLQERHIWEGHAYSIQLPNTIELMMKINELVEEVNRLKEMFEEGIV